jgi:hypothetical protein
MKKPERKDFVTDTLYDAALDAFITCSLAKIFDSIISEQEPMDSEMASVLMDNLWELYED